MKAGPTHNCDLHNHYGGYTRRCRTLSVHACACVCVVILASAAPAEMRSRQFSCVILLFSWSVL